MPESFSGSRCSIQGMHPSWSTIVADADMDPRGSPAHGPFSGRRRGWFLGCGIQRWLANRFRAQSAPVSGRFSLLALLCLLIGLPSRAAVVTNLNQGEFETALAVGGVVTFASAGTLNLTNEVLIQQDTTLDATGLSSLTFNAVETHRLFHVASGVSLTLSGVTLQNGRASFGGAIWNEGGRVIANGVVFSGNQASGTDATNALNAGDAGTSGTEAQGGAIYSDGALILTNVAFNNNAAKGGKGGNGAKGASGPWGQTGGNGGDGAAAWGGAIYATGPVVGQQVSFSGNKATAGTPGTGGPVGSGSLGLQGINGQGGRAASAFGGAVYTLGTVALTNATLSGNSAVGSVGGDGATGAPGHPGGHAIGGALHLGGAFTFLNTTFANNTAIGGAGGHGGNSPNGIVRASAGGNGGDAIGGSVFTDGGGTVFYSTWATNAAIAGTNGPAGGGGTPPTNPGQPGTPKGGSLAVSNMLGTAVCNSTLFGNGNPANVWGALSDGGYNLSSDNSVVWTHATSRQNLAPLLQPLQQNNGVLQTVGLGPGSPAIDAGDPTTAPPQDARGVARGVFNPPDIGAFELAPVFPVHGRLAEIHALGTTIVTNLVVGFDVWAGNVRTTTDTNGVFAFTNLLADTYTVYPTNLGAGFIPVSRLVTVGTADPFNPTGGATDIDFLANAPFLSITAFPRAVLTNAIGTNTMVSTNAGFYVLTNFALPSRSYLLLATTNLGTTNWLIIATNRPGVGAIGTITLTNYPGGDRSFFRVLSP
jgi:hypothetical protein